jgi:urate oxidase
MYRLDDSLLLSGFKLGSEKRTAEVYTTKDGVSKVKSGIQELILLKTTQSGFEGFIHDRYTILADTNERMMASSVRAIWSYSHKPYSYEEAYAAVKSALLSKFYGPTRGGEYSPSVQNTLYNMAKEALMKVPDVESIYLNMPNIHFLPVNLPTIGVKFKDDVYLPTDEPHGTIEASLTRKGFLPVAKL